MSLTVADEGKNYTIYISSETMRCFSYEELGHLKSKESALTEPTGASGEKTGGVSDNEDETGNAEAAEATEREVPADRLESAALQDTERAVPADRLESAALQDTERAVPADRLESAALQDTERAFPADRLESAALQDTERAVPADRLESAALQDTERAFPADRLESAALHTEGFQIVAKNAKKRVGSDGEAQG